MTVKRILILFALVILAMAAIAGANAQEVAKVELPDAPTPATTTEGVVAVWHAPRAPINQPFLASKINRSLVLATFAVRLGDAITTEDMMHNRCKCFHEDELPNALVQRPGAMYAYSLGIAFLTTEGARILWDHHHHKLARIALASGIAGDGWADLGNIRLLEESGK